MGTANGIKKPTMTPQRARGVLQGVLDNRKEIEEKSFVLCNAITVAAAIVERANADGANLHHEAGVLRYHANNITATLFCDEFTRNAIKAGIRQIDKYIEARGGGENA